MPENYSQPGWFERNLPLIAGGGTLLSRQQQYLTERQPQPVDPRNAWARAFGDSLEAFYRGQTAQQQMGANRQQLFQSSQLFPLELKKARAELQAYEHAQQMRQQFPAQIDAMFGANSKAAMVLKSMPYAQALQMMTSMLSGQLKPKAEILSEEERIRLNMPKGTVRMPDGTLQAPSEAALKHQRIQDRGPVTPITGAEAVREVLPGISPKIAEHTVLQPEDDGGFKITQMTPPRPPPKPGMTTANMQAIMLKGRQDPAFLETPEYHQAYTALHLGTKDVWSFDPVTKVPVSIQQPKIPPAQVVQPEPVGDNALSAHIASLREGKPVSGGPKISQTTQAEMDKVRVSANNLKDNVKLLKDHLKQFGTEIIGDERATQENLYGDIFSMLQILKGLGVPTGRDIELVEQQLWNPTEGSFEQWVKAGGWVFGTRAEYITRQLTELDAMADRRIKSALQYLSQGKTLAELSLETVESLEAKNKPKTAADYEAQVLDLN